jgi:hypothetical protein
MKIPQAFGTPIFLLGVLFVHPFCSRAETVAPVPETPKAQAVEALLRQDLTGEGTFHRQGHLRQERVVRENLPAAETTPAVPGTETNAVSTLSPSQPLPPPVPATPDPKPAP